MTEPVFDHNDPRTDTAWYAWLQAKDDKQLAAYWKFIKSWSPARNPGADADVMQMKYELAAQLMDKRKLNDDGDQPHAYEPGDEQHRMAGDPDCRVCGQTRRNCER
jgi:hypothetical protein